MTSPWKVRHVSTIWPLAGMLLQAYCIQLALYNITQMQCITLIIFPLKHYNQLDCAQTAHTFAKSSYLSRKWSRIRIQIKLDLDQDIWQISPKMWIHYLIGISHFTECCKNRSITVREMLVNIRKSSIPQWWRKWKSDPESVSRITSPPKVSQFFRLVGKSNQLIQWNRLITFVVILHTDRQTDQMA